MALLQRKVTTPRAFSSCPSCRRLFTSSKHSKKTPLTLRIVNRWNLRLASLIAPSVLPPLRTAGFELLHLTFVASTTSMLSQAKATIALALNVLGSNKSDPSIFVAALDVVRLVLAKGTWHPEWAREVTGAAVVQRTVNALVAAANGELEEVRCPGPLTARARLTHRRVRRSSFPASMLSFRCSLCSQLLFALSHLPFTRWPSLSFANRERLAQRLTLDRAFSSRSTSSRPRVATGSARHGRRAPRL